MNKRFLTILLTGLFLTGMTEVAPADLLVSDGSSGYVDVGSYDEFKAKSVLSNSGDADELAWINQTLLSLGITDSYTPDEFTKFDLDEDGETDPMVLQVFSDTTLTTEVEGSYAFALTDKPDYYLIKVGDGKKDESYTHFLFKNDENLDYAVFALQTSEYTIKNIGKLSHNDQVGGTKSVPEPATMLLIGTGLAGLVGFDRRRKKHNHPV